MSSYLKTVTKAVAQVFSKPGYILLAALTAVAVFYLSLWINNYSVLYSIFTSENLSLSTKAFTFLSSWEILITNHHLNSQILIVTSSLLFGLNVAMLVFYLRKRLALEKEIGSTMLGLLLAILGTGCATCGSVIVSSVISFGFAANFFALLPFGGVELGFIGILVIIFSIYLLAKKITSPLVC